MLDNSPDKQTLSLLSILFISLRGSSAKTNLQRLQLLYTKHLTYYTLSLPSKNDSLWNNERGELFYGYLSLKVPNISLSEFKENIEFPCKRGLPNKW
jgi:hypothetical protein